MKEAILYDLDRNTAMFAIRCTLLMAFLFGCILLILSLMMPEASALDAVCNGGLRLLPSGAVSSSMAVEAQHRDESLVTWSRVVLETSNRADLPVSFALRLDEGPKNLKTALVETPSIDRSAEVLLLVDIAPEELTIPPGGESPYYYLALVWRGVLNQFSFVGDPDNGDKGYLAMPAPGGELFKPFHYQNELFTEFVRGLPKMAIMSGNEMKAQRDDLLDKWRGQKNPDKAKATVILRWHEAPLNRDEYGTALADDEFGPVIIVDLLQQCSDFNIGDRTMVICLEHELNPPPDPWNPVTWDETVIPKQVDDFKAVFEGQKLSAQHIFKLEQRWSLLIDSEQLPNLRFHINVRDQPTAYCEVPVQFVGGKREPAERLLGYVAAATLVTTTVAVFMAAFWIAWLAPGFKNLIRDLKNLKQQVFGP